MADFYITLQFFYNFFLNNLFKKKARTWRRALRGAAHSQDRAWGGSQRTALFHRILHLFPPSTKSKHKNFFQNFGLSLITGRQHFIQCMDMEP